VTTATVDAKTTVRQVQTSAEAIKSNDLQRFPEGASPGDTFRQGDLYITMLDGVPEGAKKVKARLQLAEGETQGSRHCLDSARGVTMYAHPTPGPLIGPVMSLTEERTLTHPEHGHVALPPGCYGITYQRDLDQEERERRVQD
jgi:hypothetical protein